MRSYIILKKKVEKFNEDEEIQSLLDEINSLDGGGEGTLSPKALKEKSFDRSAIAEEGLKYEKLDQLLFELLLGVR
jgi:xylose isomerase